MCVCQRTHDITKEIFNVIEKNKTDSYTRINLDRRKLSLNLPKGLVLFTYVSHVL